MAKDLRTAVLVGLLAGLSGQSAAAQDSGAEIAIPVIVADSSGRFVTGLRPEHFVVAIDGVESAVTGLASTGEALRLAVIMNDRDNASLAALMDVSVGLAGRPLGEPILIDGAGSIIEQVEEGFTRLNASSGSRKAVLIIGDADGTFSQEEIRDTVAGHGMPVFALSSNGEAGAIGAPGQDEFSGGALFDELARQSGGLHLTLNESDRAGIGLANYYVLLLDGATGSGRYTPVEVTWVQPRGLERIAFDVSHRVGYLEAAN